MMRKARFLRQAGGLLAAARRPFAAIVLWSIAASALGAAAAKPSFSPAGGTYATPQTVTISSTTAGARIYYTTNGTTPTTKSAPYTGPVAVGASKTLKAIATATGYANSAAASATYTLVAGVPTFSPAAGTYPAGPRVTISTVTPGAQIYYTTDGTTPTTASPAYSSPITLSASATMRAIAIASGFSNSTVGSATYTIVPVLASLSVQAPTTTLVTGGTTQCTATGTYSDGSTRDLTTQVAWSSSDAAVASVSTSGLVTGAAVGSATITATSGTLSGAAVVSVQGGAITYCYDAAGNMTARLICATSAPCDARCP